MYMNSTEVDQPMLPNNNLGIERMMTKPALHSIVSSRSRRHRGKIDNLD